MSGDSSSVPVAESQHSPYGWLVALYVLVATTVVFFASQLAAGVAIGMYPAFKHWTQAQTNDWIVHSVSAQFVADLLAYSLFIAAIWQLMRWMHWKWQDIGLRRPQLKHLVFGLLATVPYYLLYFVAIALVSVLIPSLNLQQKQDIGFQSVRGVTELVLTFVSLAVIPPVAEEIAMRGFLYTGLRKWLPKIIAALVVSALFGAAHLSEGGSAGPLWIGAIDTFTLSLVLVFLREKTGNLWAGIVLHAAKNSVAFALLFLVR